MLHRAFHDAHGGLPRSMAGNRFCIDILQTDLRQEENSAHRRTPEIVT